MGWSNTWAVARWATPDHEKVFNDLVAALAERDFLTPTGQMPAPFAPLAVLKGTPAGGGGPTGLETVASLQAEIAAMLGVAGAWQWWNSVSDGPETLAELLTATIGAATWTHDLTAAGAGWMPPFAVIFNELREAANGLTTLRRLPTSAVSTQIDSVYHLATGTLHWSTERAATFAMFNGSNQGGTSGLVYDVGLGGTVFDAGVDRQWYLDARAMTLEFDTSTLAGKTVTGAWLEFTTAACPGTTDFSGAFTAAAVAVSGAVRGTFASNDYSQKSFALQAADVNTAGVTSFTLRSTAADTADRPAWSPAGPSYSSTYREGFCIGGTVRLVVAVEFDYHG
jgi:hypothetical protein